MKRRSKGKNEQDFDPKIFLANADKGRTLTEHRKDRKIFLQGDPADAIFYIQKGKIKLTVVSQQGKEAVVAIWERATSLARDAWLASPSVWPAPPQCPMAPSCGWRRPQ